MHTSIRKKIFFLVLVSLLLPITLIVFTYSIVYHKSMEKEIVARASLVVENFSKLSTDSLIIKDETDLTGHVESLMNMPEIIFVALYDNSGDVVVVEQKDDISAGNFKIKEKICRKVLTHSGNKAIDIIVPVYNDHKYVGCARVVFSLMELDRKLTEMNRKILISYLILGLFISMAIAFYLGSSIANPINKLVEMSKKIAGRNYSERIYISTGDEIQLLAESYNNMSEKIQSYIAELKDSADLIREKNDQIYMFKKFTETSNQGMGWVDRKGMVVYANTAFLKITGQNSLFDCKDKNLFMYYSGDMSPEVTHNILNEVLAKGNWDGEANLTTANNKTIRTYIHIFVLGNADESSPYLGFIINDITQLKELQEQLNQKNKMNAIGELAGGIAHDFNNMLAGILGGAELLEKKVKENKGHKYLEIINKSALRARELTEQLLTFARKKSSIYSPLDIHDIINDAVSLLERTIDKRIVIEKKLVSPDRTIVGDSSSLQNAFINLGINASHAIKDAGCITFETNQICIDPSDTKIRHFNLQPGSYIEVKVADTGVGIPPENVNRIFEPFFTTKPQGQGTGLGLSSVYGTVVRHNGAIYVQSEVGKGTIFYLLFPLSQETIRQYIDAVDIKNDITLKNKICVLVVDDEEVVRITMEDVLKEFGCDVILAENGQKAVEIFQQKSAQIDLVILDMNMPHMSGMECFEALHNINKNVKIIVSSGFANDEDIKKLYSTGLVSFIHKPILSSELYKEVVNALKVPKEK